MNKFVARVKSLGSKWKGSPIGTKSVLVVVSATVLLTLSVLVLSMMDSGGLTILPLTGQTQEEKCYPKPVCVPEGQCKCNGAVCGKCSYEDPDPRPTAIIIKPTSTTIPKPTNIVIPAPSVVMSCTGDVNSLYITWKNNLFIDNPNAGISLPPSVRVDISYSFDGTSQSWSLSIPANKAFSVLAPVGPDGTFVSPINGSIMGAITKDTTYQVRVWYEAPYNKYSATTIFKTPSAANWNCPAVDQTLPSLGNVESPADAGNISGGVMTSGWFLDPQGVKEVQVYMDNVLLGKATLGISRPDVATVYPNYKNKNAGFNFWFPTTQIVNGVSSAKYANGAHTLTYKMYDNKATTPQMTIIRKVTINNILTKPVVQQYCDNGVNKLWITWDNAGLNETDFYVDVEYWETPTINHWYNSRKNTTPYQVVAPDQFTDGNDTKLRMPLMLPGKDVYISLYFQTLGRHSLSEKITTVNCGIIQNTITPTVSISEMVTPTVNTSITPQITITGVPVPPAVSGLNPVGTINPGVQDIRWDSIPGIVLFGLRVDDTTDGVTEVCISPGTNGDLCIDINTNHYSYNFIAGHTYHISVHAIAFIAGPDTSSDVTVALNPLTPIPAPNLYVSCVSNLLNMQIDWNSQNLGAQSYWVDISLKSDFVGNFWHKELASNATSLSASAPVDIDRGYFVEYQWPNPIMPSLQPNTTYYVKIWYHTPIYRNSIIRSVVTPGSCGSDTIVPVTTTIPITTTVPPVTTVIATNTPVVTGTVTGPNVMATCDVNKKAGLDIAWAVDPVMGAYGYWVDIAQTLNGFNDGTYWHHGYGKPTDVEARAPIETDGSYYFNKSDMNMKWTGLQTPGTWYVRIWYAKTGTFSNITTYTYPAELTCP